MSQQIGVTIDGEANFLGLATEFNWVARIQFNGELLPEKQQEIAERFAEVLQGIEFEVSRTPTI